jgi:WD40 repeat protein
LNNLQFSPDERLLAIADDNIRLIGLNTEKESSSLRDDKLAYRTVRFDSSGSELLTINSQSRIEIINLRSQTISTTLCCSIFYGEVSFVGSDLKIVNEGHWPRVWTRTGDLIRALAPNREIETLRPIAVDEAGKRIFMGSQDGRFYEWSLADFKLIGKSPAQANYVDTIALLPSLGLLAYCSFEKEVHLWWPGTSRTAETLAANPSSNVVALPDGVSIVFGTDSGTIQIWKLKASPHLTSEVKIF